ncbi:MAG: pseudouridine synthase [Firmicutes bacterium]|nr:pseudouridine synthase [Bacillota bacterium]
MRINVFISSKGYCSRRQADRLILNGKVFINGIQADIGQDATENDEVIVNGELISKKLDYIYLAFHKPKGIVSTTDETKKGNIISYLNYPERIFPIGRLDKDSSGLILLTNDGQIVNPILRSEFNHEKEYIVFLDKEINSNFLSAMEKGVTIYNPVKNEYTLTKPTVIKQLSVDSFSIVLTQGLNLQIRRMVKSLGYQVRSLHRIRIMNILLENLDVGKFRPLSFKEIEELKNLIHIE